MAELKTDQRKRAAFQEEHGSDSKLILYTSITNLDFLC